MTPKMKILFLNSCVSGGGAGRSLTSYLENEGKEIEAHVVMPEPGVIEKEIAPFVAKIHIIPEFVERIQTSKYRWVQKLDWTWLHWSANFFSSLVARHKIARIVREIQPDLIYCNHMLAKVIGLMVSATTGTPVVLHARNFHNTGFGRLFYQFLGNLRSVKAIICNSHATSMTYRKYSNRKVTVIHNFINVSKFHPIPSGEETRKEFGIPEDAVVIGFSGRIVEWKGVDILIRAFAKLYERFPKAYLCILGDNDGGLHHDLKGEYQNLAQDVGVSDRTIFIPFQADIRPVFASFDLLALPSREPEPFGRVIIEAMAMGVPPVVAAHGGTLEIVEHNVEGKIFVPRSSDSLAAVLADVLLKPVFRKALGETAQLAVSQRFSGRVLAPQITRALQRVVNRQDAAGEPIKQRRFRFSTKFKRSA